MEYERARGIGEAGEREVSRELAKLSRTFGFRYLDNVLLQVGRKTAQLDHVVIDRHGVLILETKVRHDALIKGTDVEKRWTACYPGKRRETFQNPLNQNREHESTLRRALKDAGALIDPNYVTSAVVFVGANIEHLDLDALSKEQVISLDQLGRYFAKRNGFSINAGGFAAEHVDRYMGWLRALDKSQDAAVKRQHDQHRGGAVRSGEAASVPALPRAQAPAERPRVTFSAPHGTRMRSQVGAPQRPTAARPVTGVPGSRLSKASVTLGGRVLVIGAFALFLLFMLSGLFTSAITRAITGGAVGPAPTVGVPAASASTGSLQLAKQRLYEVSPEFYTRVTDLDSPQVKTQGDLTTYTWHYVEKLNNNSAKVTAFALVIASDGKVRAMHTGQ